VSSLIIGLDSNVLCYSLDPAYPEHPKLKDLLLGLSTQNMLAINPTVIHEAYHALVFGQKWLPNETKLRLGLVLKHPFILFYSQTKRTCIVALSIAGKYGLGGRDSLVLANFLLNKIPVVYTHDDDLLKLKKVSWKESSVELKDPLAR